MDLEVSTEPASRIFLDGHPCEAQICGHENLGALKGFHLMKIFVASSTAARAQAKAFIKGCKRADIEFLPWWDQFTPGKTLLEELTRIRNQIDRAVIVLSPESNTKLRRRKQTIPNLNVLFEFGFFYGTLGPDHVAVVRYGQFYLPSDLGGYIVALQTE